VKLIIDRFTLVIEPENDQDIAYIEDTLGLLKNGDAIWLERLDSDRGLVLETDITERCNGPVCPPAKTVSKKKYPDPELARQFKDFGEGNELERTASRNGGETLVDIQAIED